MTAYPRMQAWFGWFMRTQPGELPVSFQWRGRERAQEFDAELNKKTFASGSLSQRSIHSMPSLVMSCMPSSDVMPCRDFLVRLLKCPVLVLLSSCCAFEGCTISEGFCTTALSGAAARVKYESVLLGRPR